MSRAEDCVDAMHSHVGRCQRQGYRNGLADAADAIEAQIAKVEASRTASLILEDALAAVSDLYA